MPSALVFVLAAFCAGVVALSWCAELPSEPLAILGFGVGAIVAAWRADGRSSIRHRHARLVLAVVGAASIGLGYAAWRSRSVLADELPQEWEGEDIGIVGIVDELPRAAWGGVRFAFAVERVDTPGARVPGRVSIAWYAPGRGGADDDDAPNVPHVRAGERWALTVRLVRPHGSVNPAGFDLEGWLFAHGLRANGYVRADGDNRRIDAFAARPRDYVERERERIRERIFSALAGGEYAGVLAALTIGDQRAIPESQWTLFNRTGIAHLVSISGLHVTVFATLAGGVAYTLLRRSPRITTRCAARRISVLFGTLASAGYVALAGAEVPALRTLAMLTVAAIGLWLARPGTGRSVWFWALTAVLACDPWAPLAPGFWLSFAAVAMLIYAMSARLPAAQRGGWAMRTMRKLAAAARTQWIVTIGLVPLTLALFGQLSLISPIANAIAIPVVTFLVVPLALLAAAIPVDALWLAAHGGVALLIHVLEPLAALPDAVWVQHAPAAWTVVAGSVGVALLLAPPAFPGRLLGIVWMLPLFMVAPPAPSPGQAIVTVLDVGQGLAVTVRTERHAMLYDTGPRYSPGADAGGRIVAPFLRAQGMSRLSMMMVTHADIDHSGGGLSILATVPVATLSSSLPFDHAIVRRMPASAADRCEAGQRWEWDGVRFSVLHPSRDAYDDPSRKTNDLSCVLRIETSQGTVLLAGDIEARSEYELLGRNPGSLSADVLVMPHHGSRTSSTPAFVAAVAPRRAIIAAGYRNRFGHPRADVVARYTAHGIAISRTDVQGAVMVTLGPGGIDVLHARESLRRYWHARDPPP